MPYEPFDSQERYLRAVFAFIGILEGSLTSLKQDAVLPNYGFMAPVALV